MATTTLAALCAWKARRLWGLIGGVVAVLVFVSICCVKQHYVVDGIVSVGLAYVVYWYVVRPYEAAPEDRQRVAYGWGGLVAYLGVHLALLVGFLAGWLIGWEPWA